MAEVKDMQPSARRKRVERLKRLIVISLLASILIPVILCVVLLVKLRTLEDEISRLNGQLAEKEQMQYDILSGEAQRSSSAAVDVQEAFSAVIKPEAEAPKEEAPKESVPKEAQVRKVYLTFDDGPSGNTDKILDILAEYDVKATFFVVGKEAEWAREAYCRIAEEGHTLGMHTYTHKYGEVYASVEAFAADLGRLQGYLYETTGILSRYFRFPGGSSNTVSEVDMKEFIAYLNEQELTYFDWNVSSGDASSRGLSAEEILQNCLQGIEKHRTVVILMHDAAGRDSTVEALPLLIEAVQAMENTELLPITEETVTVQHIKITQDETED